MRIGITSPHPAWQQILDQEKVFYSLLSTNKTIALEKIPVLICARATRHERALAERHLHRGGALIVDASIGEGYFTRFRDQIFRVPMDLSRIVNNHEYLLKNFIQGEVVVHETVARQSKAGARKAVVQTLKQAFWSKGLPYAHLWYYPRGYRSLFSFRFDMDEFDSHDHIVFLDLLRESQGSISCFASMKTFEKNSTALQQVVETGVELASHSYIHHIYHNYTQNDWNLSQAEKLLSQSVEGRVIGFSGPHGKWHPSLQSVLEDRGYEYSSEFCLDYDDLPFFPYHRGRFSSVLQIPTHPVCEGIFLEKYGYDQKMFESYYGAVIDQKIQSHEPVLIFGHPDKRLGRYPEIFRFIQRKVRDNHAVWLAEFRKISEWWKRRHLQTFDLAYENGFLRSQGLHPDFEIHYQFPGQTEGWADSANLSAGVRCELKSSGEVAAQYPIPREEETPKSWLKRLKSDLKLWLDWETKTPHDQIRIVDMPTLIKRIMRSFVKPGGQEEIVYGA